MSPRVLFLILLSTLTARAATLEGEVSAVDVRAGTVTLTVKGKPQTWRVRPDTEVTVNGEKSPLTGIAPKMTAKVTSADPSVATRLEAATPPAARVPIDVDDGLTGPERRAKYFGVKIIPSGSTNPDGSPAESPLAADLAETKWRTNDGKVITLHANGTLEGNWPGAQGIWRATGEHAAVWTLAAKARQADQVSFDAETKAATWRDDAGRTNTARRLAR